MKVSESRGAWLLALPYVAGTVLLVFLPAAATFGLSFTDYDLINAPSWVGLDNFRALARDPAFADALVATLLLVALAVPLRVAGALALALLLHRRFAGVGVHRTSGYLPTVVPDVALALVWLYLLNPLYGPVNLLLGAAGLPEPEWFTSEAAATVLLVLVTAFAVGEGFLIALAVRRELPDELYELALAEGSSPTHTFRRLTLPLMAPTLALLTVRDLALSLQLAFVPALLVTGGGPNRATTILPLHAYRTAFEHSRYGYAAAMTLVGLALSLLAVAALSRPLRRGRLGLA